MTNDDPLRSELSTLGADFRSALAFLTRLPAAWLGGMREIPLDFTRAARTFPLVGVVVGLVGGLVLVIAAALDEPPLVSAGLAVLATMLFTGALHEDGLADTADGFGGGKDVAGRLAIMDDSRLGTYGGLAIAISLILRVATLSALLADGPLRAALVLVGAEAVSRAAMVRLWHQLPPAKPGSLSQTAGVPDQQAMGVALAIAGLVVILTVLTTFRLGATLVAVLLAALVSYLFADLCNRAIGGRTGDTLGACQQLAAIAFLVGAAAFA
jgi:adenosylcobinamide-GDP ribazoletransferase